MDFEVDGKRLGRGEGERDATKHVSNVHKVVVTHSLSLALLVCVSVCVLLSYQTGKYKHCGGMEECLPVALLHLRDVRTMILV